MCCFPRPGGPEESPQRTRSIRARSTIADPLPTFHARDVLAPAAAALACGVDASSLGDAD